MNLRHVLTKQASREATGRPAAARQTGRLLAGLLGLFLTGIAAAGGTAESEFAVWVIGLPNGYVVMEHQTQALEVTADDVARGTLEVKGGTRIVIITTQPSRVALDFRAAGTLFKAVQIEGMGRSAEMGPAGGTILESSPATGRRVVSIDYRFTLAPETVPGTFSWPLALNVRSVAAANLAPSRLTRGLAAAGVERH